MHLFWAKLDAEKQPLFTKLKKNYMFGKIKDVSWVKKNYIVKGNRTSDKVLF